MGQKKLIRFEEIKSFKNVFEYPENKKGHWCAFFGNSHDITLELACGKGEYTVGLAQMYPARNFIGVDLKGNRIWRGAKNAIEEGLDNVAFLRTQIDKINHYFDRSEVAEIWITFPDPQLRGSKIRKRLTHPKFLRMYQGLLKPGGKVHLKTDSPDLYHFTKKVIEMYGLSLITDDDHVFSKSEVQPELKIKTHYESLDIAGSNRIHYLQFLLDRELPLELDEQLKEMFSNKNRDAAL